MKTTNATSTPTVQQTNGTGAANNTTKPGNNNGAPTAEEAVPGGAISKMDPLKDSINNAQGSGGSGGGSTDFDTVAKALASSLEQSSSSMASTAQSFNQKPPEDGVYLKEEKEQEKMK